MQVISNPIRSSWDSLIGRPIETDIELEAVVQDIIYDVLDQGDQALIDYTEKLDGVTGLSLTFPNPANPATLGPGPFHYRRRIYKCPPMNITQNSLHFFY